MSRQTMNYDEMLTWLLFYTSIFATQKTPMVDVIDPAGLVRSQVIENDDGALRLTLNGAENRRTLAGHFIAESFGSGVQHLAFATDDIFATAAALAAATASCRCAISPNYYDDVEARFGLDPDFAERLQRRQHPLRPRRARRVLPALQRRPSARASSSRSSSGAAIAAMARQRALPHRCPKKQTSGRKACQSLLKNGQHSASETRPVITAFFFSAPASLRSCRLSRLRCSSRQKPCKFSKRPGWLVRLVKAGRKYFSAIFPASSVTFYYPCPKTSDWTSP